MLVRQDIVKLWNHRDDQYAVMCVKHNYIPADRSKYLGNEQDSYEKKNWSSLMLMNCGLCMSLTPGYVNEALRLDLHQFRWLQNPDSEIGELPSKWNHLVGYGQENPNASLVHYTTGGPYFREYRDVEYAKEWGADHQDMLRCDQVERRK